MAEERNWSVREGIAGKTDRKYKWVGGDGALGRARFYTYAYGPVYFLSNCFFLQL